MCACVCVCCGRMKVSYPAIPHVSGLGTKPKTAKCVPAVDWGVLIAVCVSYSHTPSLTNRYVWHPPQQSRRHSDPLLGDSLNALSLNTHPRYLFSQPGNVGDGGRRGREGEGGRRGEGGGGRGGGRGEGGGGTSGDKLKALGLPRLVGTQKDPTKVCLKFTPCVRMH